jgi:hypothetical protein
MIYLFLELAVALRRPHRLPYTLVELKKGDMSCRSCGLGNERKFAAEMSVHVLGVENVDKPVVWVFPELLVCMDCGFTELAIAENELHLLGKVPAKDIGAAG